ncbi:MAG: metallophosphoesterase [Caldilineaceae bacterium]|nr:metallophosphoesterase [Caldilineaceae bacterium]
MIIHPLSRLIVCIFVTIFGVGLVNRCAPLEAPPQTLPLENAVGGAGTLGERASSADRIAADPNVKVAFIGDSDDGDDFGRVIQLIQEEGVDLVLHQGDFSYANGPTDEWLAAVGQLDTAIPYLGADGNHDHWNRYVSFFETQAQKPGVALTAGSIVDGSYAVTYKGLHILFNHEGGDVPFNQQVLTDSPHIWKLCTWHHNRRDFQPGSKGDEVTLENYQACINGGALIATGHEHSYSRSYSLRDLSAAQHGAYGQPDVMELTPGNPGSSFFFVSGLGGRSLRDYSARLHDGDGWWATIFTEDRYCRQTCTASDFSAQDQSQDISSYAFTFGALFIDFGVDDDPTKGRGYFKTVDGDIVDEFTIVVKPNQLAESQK